MLDNQHPQSDEVLDVLATTRAIRRFRFERIPTEDLNKILFAATRAPTGSNRQNMRLLVLADGDNARKAKVLLGEAFRAGWVTKRTNDGYDQGSGRTDDSPKAKMARSMQRFVDNFEATPVVVLACIWQRHWSIMDGASVYPACQNLLIAARSLGYGGVLTGWHASVSDELHELLDIPSEVTIAATIALGIPQGRHGPVRRRPLQELVFEDTWAQAPVWLEEPEGTRHTAAGPPQHATLHNQ